MHRKLINRGVIVAGLTILLLIGLSSVRGLVYERNARSAEVRHEIARSAAGEQQLIGPVLVINYTYPWTETYTDDSTGVSMERETLRTGTLHLLPETLKVEGRLQTDIRTRGIYSANLFRTTLDVSGSFRIARAYGLADRHLSHTIDDVKVAVGIADIRGITGTPAIDLSGQKVTFLPGTGNHVLAQGIHADFGKLLVDEDAALPFSFSVELLGTDVIRFTPVGRTSVIELAADWPHPGFIGDFLPADRTINSDGFTARWSTSSIATNLDEHFNRCPEYTDDCSAIISRHLGVSLVNPVDHYFLSERATKHGILFIGLTFIGFFLFEVMKSIAIHPIQYTFVGAGLLVFYLLLLSLAEHIGFGLAYLTSAIACIGLIGAYVTSVLGSVGRSALLTGGLALLYGCLYTVLNAEDYALLLGSGVLFVVLAVVMRLTSKINWFNLEQQNVAVEPQQ